MFKGKVLFLLCVSSLVACSTSKPFATVLISETTGLDRKLEYVSATVPLEIPENTKDVLIAIDKETGVNVPVQILDSTITEDKKMVAILFPVGIKANESKRYLIEFGQEPSESELPMFKLSEDTFSVENETYKASFSTEDDARGGQINGITLRNFNDQMLKRGHIAMHWAPNFSKSDSEGYFNFEDLSATSKNNISENRYQIVKQRSGNTDSVPEIDMTGKYTFYKSLPYFDFESTMVMNSDVELNLLRNDEITMDSLFTHVTYQNKGGKTKHLELYTEALDTLKTSPISADANFVALYNIEKGYGLSSIRREFDNTDVDGNPSPVYDPHTKITKSSNNGRYWSRVLTDTVHNFSKGSRYHEKNAYLIFEVDKESPEKEILYYHKRLKNPLTVTVQQ